VGEGLGVAAGEHEGTSTPTHTVEGVEMYGLVSFVGGRGLRAVATAGLLPAENRLGLDRVLAVTASAVIRSSVTRGGQRMKGGRGWEGM
jgi:hypothetical protein